MKKQINQLGGPAITREKKKGWLNTEIGYFSILATVFLSTTIAMLFGRETLLDVCAFWLGFAIALMFVYAIKISRKKTNKGGKLYEKIKKFHA